MLSLYMCTITFNCLTSSTLVLIASEPWLLLLQRLHLYLVVFFCIYFSFFLYSFFISLYFFHSVSVFSLFLFHSSIFLSLWIRIWWSCNGGRKPMFSFLFLARLRFKLQRANKDSSNVRQKTNCGQLWSMLQNIFKRKSRSPKARNWTKCLLWSLDMPKNAKQDCFYAEIPIL